MFLKFYVLLPVLFLFLAWFLGSKPWGWALVGLIGWYGGIVFFLLTVGEDGGPILLLFCLVMSMLGLWVASLAGVALGRVERPAPVEVTVEAASQAYDKYESLDSAAKAKLQAGARLSAKFGCNVAAEYLQGKGNRAMAKAFKHLGRTL